MCVHIRVSVCIHLPPANSSQGFPRKILPLNANIHKQNSNISNPDILKHTNVLLSHFLEGFFETKA